MSDSGYLDNSIVDQVVFVLEGDFKEIKDDLDEFLERLKSKGYNSIDKRSYENIFLAPWKSIILYGDNRLEFPLRTDGDNSDVGVALNELKETLNIILDGYNLKVKKEHLYLSKYLDFNDTQSVKEYYDGNHMLQERAARNGYNYFDTNYDVKFGEFNKNLNIRLYLTSGGPSFVRGYESLFIGVIMYYVSDNTLCEEGNIEYTKEYFNSFIDSYINEIKTQEFIMGQKNDKSLD